MLENNMLTNDLETSPPKKEDKSLLEKKEMFDLSEQIYSRKKVEKDHMEIKKLKAIITDL